MNIKPLADRVLILPAPAEEKTIGGIIIPDTAKEKPLQGKVVATGHGTKDEEMVLKEDLLAALRHELATWKKINRTIVMMLANGFSEADVGKTVGLSQKAVNKRKHKLYSVLKNRLQDFR